MNQMNGWMGGTGMMGYGNGLWIIIGALVVVLLVVLIVRMLKK